MDLLWRLCTLVIVHLAVVDIGHVEGFCDSFYNETNPLPMCQDGSMEIQEGGSFLFLDSAGAPDFAAIECSCNITMDYSQTLEVYYRSPGPISGSCEIEFKLDDLSWQCEEFLTPRSTQFSPKFNTLHFTKKRNDTREYFACIGIEHIRGRLRIDCAASRPYVDPAYTTAAPPTTQPPTTGNNTNTEASQGNLEESDTDWTLIGSILGAVFLAALVFALICFIMRRRKPKKPKIQSQFSTTSGDVIITENELYNYDGENPTNAYNAIFVGGIPVSPGDDPDQLPPGYRGGTADRRAVVAVDDTKPRPRPKPPAKPMLKSFRGPSFIENEDQTFVKEADGGLVVDLPKSRALLGEDEFAPVSVYNPAFDQDYLNAAPRSNASRDSPSEFGTASRGPPSEFGAASRAPPSEFGTGQTSSSSPYDYIDHSKLERDDAEFSDNFSFSDDASVTSSPYKNVPNGTGTMESDHYKRIIDVPSSVIQADGPYGKTMFPR